MLSLQICFTVSQRYLWKASCGEAVYGRTDATFWSFGEVQSTSKQSRMGQAQRSGKGGDNRPGGGRNIWGTVFRKGEVNQATVKVKDTISEQVQVRWCLRKVRYTALGGLAAGCLRRAVANAMARWIFFFNRPLPHFVTKDAFGYKRHPSTPQLILGKQRARMRKNVSVISHTTLGTNEIHKH